MNGWITQEIRQLGKVVTGKTPPTMDLDYYNGNELFVSPKDLDYDAYFIRETQTQITQKALEKFKNQLLPKNSIMFTSLSFAFGKIGISSRPSLTNQQINSIIINGSNYYKFIYYLLQIYRPIIFSFNSGIDTPIVIKSVFEKIEVKVPKRKIHQKKIAAILSAYDDLIENNKRRIALLEKMAEEIYREWFVRFRFPGHEKVKFVKGVPEGWSIQKIENIVGEIRKGISRKSLIGTEKYIGLEHIPRKSISIKDYTTTDSIESNKLIFKRQDILFSKIRPYLHKVALAHFDGVCSSDTIILRAKNENYIGFLLFTVFSESFIELATIASKGTKMPRADWDFLKKLELKIPTDNLLKQYQKIFDGFFSQIEKLLLSNEILTLCRDSLLPRLISDKLSVEDLDIQFPPNMQTEEET
ncbi:restriction endonuclease subunit S [uncultured Desulfobacter sp.]|uniref:restriction endonuclease subunit S n=1 Tax=uncultured Desulfobacter sp. TaxID=240139 RepID=UPI002AAC2F77|nr:restriction endonuclease subunit S [uncultured Desulfobacter sp.]